MKTVSVVTALLLVICLMLPLAACAGGGGAGLQVREVWSRQSPKMANAGAVYMVIENKGIVDDALLAAATDIADKVEIHETIMEGDVMKMRPVEGSRLLVPAGELVELEPGGLHVMLIGMKKQPEPGSTFDLMLQFEKAGGMKVEVEVKETGATGIDG